MNSIREVAEIRPSANQLDWQRMEFYAFIHFSVNTFTDREWGLGDESPQLVNPTEFNADQWVEVCKSAGMRGLILTCKHHDGFCLWPSLYTEHSIKNSPWRNGKGDIVKEVSEACKRGGIKFGIYLSPWDRHEKTYGDSRVYNEHFKKQLGELLSNYGDIFAVWFDGACGEGPNGKRQVYDWDGYYEVIRQLQPKAVISVCGPDVRWCGNEAGHCRKAEWSVVPEELLNVEKIQDKSQKVDEAEFAKKTNSGDEDLGSRGVIKDCDRLVWYPAEVNTSIRPGWFYHSGEDGCLKSIDELLSIYYGAVGGNANFLLNIPPDKRGLINERDASLLREFGDTLRGIFGVNLASAAEAFASETCDSDNEGEGEGEHGVCNIFSEDTNTYWCTKEGTEAATIEIDLREPKDFDKISLMEYIEVGQRIEAFRLEYLEEGIWKPFYEGTTVGYRRICCFERIIAQYIRVNITHSRWCPTISFIGVY